MVVLGILLLLAGSIARYIADDSATIGDQSFSMDSLGTILLILGIVSLLFGLLYMLMGSNTRHREEHDIYVDRVPEEEPRVVRRRRPRYNRRGVDDNDYPRKDI